MEVKDLLKIAEILEGGSRDNESQEHPYEVGENYLIRTVTMIYTGKLVKVFNQELVLSGAAWIPETNRYSESIQTCEFSEVEMLGKKPVIIPRGSILDVVVIDRLPTETT